MFIGSEKEKTPNLRKLMEEPWQWIQAAKYDEAEAILTNFSFVMAKCKANRFERSSQRFPTLQINAKQEAREPLSNGLDIWQEFMNRNAHILRRATSDWTADRILLQLAVEHADDSPLTIAAEQWLEAGDCDWTWLRDIQRPALMQTDPCIAVLEGHSGPVAEALVLDNGHILSWSGDHTLCLWDGQTGGPLVTMAGHSGKVTGVIVLDDGRILSWSQDGTLRLWDGQTGAPLVTMAGHTGGIEEAEILEDGRILSWSGDRTLRLWDGQTGAPLATWGGHSAEIRA